MDNNRQEVFNRLLKLIEKNPFGFTANKNGEKLNLKKGYAVSLTNNKAKNINLLIENVLNLNEKLNFNIGGWFDKENLNYFLDLTIIEPSLIVAESIAKEFNQKAIFDFQNLTEIKV